MSSTAVPAPNRQPGRSTTTRRGALAALSYRDFRVLLFSTMALQIGSWVQTIGQGWLVHHDLNGSARDLAFVALLRGSSLIVVAPFGGHFAGKYERRRQLIFYTAGSATIATILAVLTTTGSIELWMVYCTAIAAGVVEALAQPIRSLLVYDSVHEDHLMNAVALNSLGGNAMRVIGPSIGGVLIGVVGTQGTFALQAVCLCLSLVLTWFLRPSKPEIADGKEGLFRSVGKGMRYVVRSRRMLAIVGMGVLPSLFIYPYVTFLPVFATDVLKSNETAYGLLAASVGLGSLVGGVVAAMWKSGRKMGPSMLYSCFFYALAVGAFALSRNLLLAIFMLAIAGVFHSIYSALQASLMQLQAEPEFRSRVMSLQVMMGGLTPFAGLAMGRMIDGWSAPPVVFAFMMMACITTVAVALISREIRRV